MDRLSEMEAFITVVDRGGFTGAADRLGISKSAVSKYISALEARLGARLLDRTTRRVSATEIGQTYYESAKLVLNEAQRADDSVTALQSEPRGLLRVSVPVDFGRRFLSGAISDFLNEFDKVSVELELNDAFVDLISERFDIALRIGNLPDSSLIARKIAATELCMVASPEYLEREGTPETIDDLSRHKLLHYSLGATGNVWKLTSKNGEERQVRTGGALSANNGEVLLQAALSGLGIAYLPCFFLGDTLQSGQLVQILKDLPAIQRNINLTYPPGRYTQPKTRAFIDFMAQHFIKNGPLNW